MTDENAVNLRIAYSTAAAESVAAFAAARYDLPGPLKCTLLNRGFNDTFVLSAGDGFRHILRVSGKRRRGDADVEAETRFLAHLDAAGVPVAAARPTREGALFTEMDLPEGRRPVVLFRHVEGREADYNSPADARSQGATLARIHAAADLYPSRAQGRYRLDLDHLLHRPLAAVFELEFITHETRRDLAGLASRLAGLIEARIDLSWTRCHGDCHGGNSRIATDGPHEGQAIAFDFDDGGFGYLAYDLAVHLWAQTSFGRKKYAVWRAFIDGYRAIRPIAPQDFEAAHLFSAVRHIWLMGEYAGRLGEWGGQSLAWLDKQMDFLREWEAERLSPGLLAR
jgi:Ser/Thr protein kinase RdoA (MazF antagonist)